MKIIVENQAGGDRQEFRTVSGLLRALCNPYTPNGGYRLISCDGEQEIDTYFFSAIWGREEVEKVLSWRYRPPVRWRSIGSINLMRNAWEQIHIWG